MNATVSRRPRLALIGVSGYAQIFVDLLTDEKNANRCDFAAAVVIPRDQHLEVVNDLRSRGVTIYKSFEACMEAERGRLDLCIIPTGIQWHSRMTIAALESGANVLVEKPLAGSLEDAEAMIRAQDQTGRWLAVGFQDIYSPDVTRLKQELVEGAIGPIKSIRMIGLWPRSGAYYTRNNWAGRLIIEGAAAMDSPLNNALAHFVNLSLYFAGGEINKSSPATVVDGELYRAHKIEGFDTAVVRAKAPSGIRFWFGVTHACGIYREPEILIEGENGHAAWYHGRHCLVSPDGREPVKGTVPDYDSARQSMLDAVLRKLDEPGAVVCGSDIAIEHIRFIDSLHRTCSIETIPDKLIEPQKVPGHENPVPVIKGIDRYFDEALAKQCLLRDVGFRPGTAAV